MKVKLDFDNFTINPDFETEINDKLKLCEELINSTPMPKRLEVLSSWMRCIDTLYGLGFNDNLKAENGVRIHNDFADLSFGFSAGGLHGGFIFHRAYRNGTDPEKWGNWSLHT